jgi:hypothetical protein
MEGRGLHSSDSDQGQMAASSEDANEGVENRDQLRNVTYSATWNVPVRAYLRTGEFIRNLV